MGFIRIQLKSMGSFMRQFSSCRLWGLFELSWSLGWHWLRAPPILTPVHETMYILHVCASQLTYLQGLPWRVPGLLTPWLSSSDLQLLEVQRPWYSCFLLSLFYSLSHSGIPGQSDAMGHSSDGVLLQFCAAGDVSSAWRAHSSPFLPDMNLPV